MCGPREGLEAVQKELKDDEALPKLLVFGIALIGLGLLIANTALVAWFIIRKRIKGKNNMKLIFCCLLARQSSDFCFILSLFLLPEHAPLLEVGLLSIFFGQFSLRLPFDFNCN